MKKNNIYKQLADACHSLLQKEDKLLNYLYKRNVAESTIKKYNLGFFPTDLRILFEQIEAKRLVEAGLIWNAQIGPFKNYPLVIPIKNLYGEEIAIAARTMLSEKKRKELGIPKYMNSIYSKSSHLFGLEHAINKIRIDDVVYITEGYFDVITAQATGILNTVGTCGTALSSKQIITLSRYTNNINIIFDNDDAGKTAALKAIDKYKNKKLNMKITHIPVDYKDLDEYLTKTGIEIL